MTKPKARRSPSLALAAFAAAALTLVLACAPGTYLANPGGTACNECTPGQFSSSPSSTGCALCRPGKYSSESGSSLDCTSCATGTFENNEGATACAKCAAPLEPMGTHAACCPGLERSNRHKQIQEVVVTVVKPETTFFVRAPHVEIYYAKKPEEDGDDVDNTASMADIGITLKNTHAESPILVDFTVVAPVKGMPKDYPSAGTTACEAEAKKSDQYNKRYAIPGDKLVGFGVETTGALGAQAKAFLHRVATAAGGSPRLIAQRYRNMTAAIAVALKKALANIEKRYLALCVNAPEG
jgi:hypothetical protein